MIKPTTKHYRLTLEWLEPGNATIKSNVRYPEMSINTRLNDITDALIYHADNGGKAAVTITIERLNDTSPHQGGTGAA